MNRYPLEHWVVPGPDHLGQRLHQGSHMGLEDPISSVSNQDFARYKIDGSH